MVNKDYGNLENCLLEGKEPYDRLPTSEGLLEESDSLCIFKEDNVRREELQLQEKDWFVVKK